MAKRSVVGVSRTDPQTVVAEVAKVVMCAAGLVASHAAETPIDGLPLEADAGGLDLGDDVAACELGPACTDMESCDGVENGVPAARTAIGDRGPRKRDSDRGSVDGVRAVRIV